MNIEEEIKNLGITIKTNESDLSKAEGSMETLMKRLLDEESIKTEEEAQNIVKELDDQILLVETDMGSKITELKEIYSW